MRVPYLCDLGLWKINTFFPGRGQTSYELPATRGHAEYVGLVRDCEPRAQGCFRALPC